MKGILPKITIKDFTLYRGKYPINIQPRFIMAFDNGQKVLCWGYEKIEPLIAKCESYYLSRPNITKYKIHEHPNPLADFVE